jgi:protein gp37
VEGLDAAMSDNSAIEWTDASWSPIRARNLKTGKIGWHCEHKTTGCEFCYAEGFNKRFGTGLPFKPGHRADIELFLDEKTLALPIKWRRPRMIFVCSMTDLFADFVTDAWIEIMFHVMGQTPQHTYQILTKRPERMLRFLTDPKRRFRHQICDGMGCNYCGDHDGRVPWKGYEYPNVWLGTSCERQQEFDERHTWLGSTPAAVRFFSFEPLLGPINTKGALDSGVFKWSIVGGESGPNARPMEIAWARSLVEQCKAAGTACFMKQLGSATGFNLHSKKGSDPNEWPNDLRVRQFPGVKPCAPPETAAS